MSWASRHNLLARSVNRNLGGVSVLWGAVSGEALLEQNTELVVNDQVLSVEYALHNLRADLFGALNFGDNLTVAGENYEVRHAPLLVGDGRYCVVMLAKSTSPVPTTIILNGDWV
jgi:hypothetical protein